MASILRLIEILWQFQTKLANRRTATAKFAQRFYTVWADSTQWGTRRIAAIEKFVVSANVGFLAQGPTHPIGHQPSLVTGSFLASHLAMVAPSAIGR